MKMKEVMDRTGLAENTIRFYESKGLVTPETQRKNGRTYHEYSEENVRTLLDIVILRKAQFSLEEIRRMQGDPAALTQVVHQYRQRAGQEAETLSRLAGAEELERASDWHDLSQKADAAMRRIPGYEPHLNFAQFEEEENRTPVKIPEEKKGHGNIIAIMILSVLCAALAVSTFLLARDRLYQIPAASGSTEGWAYYSDGQGLLRQKEDGSGRERVYEKVQMGGELEFLVGEEKIYLRDGQEIYCFNADGSGVYKFHPAVYSSYLALIGLEDGFLYAREVSGGQLGGNESCLVKISTQTGKGEKVNIQPPEDWVYGDWHIWDGRLYIVGQVETEMEMEDGEAMWVTDYIGLQIYDLETEKLLQETTLEGSGNVAMIASQEGEIKYAWKDYGGDYRMMESPGAEHLMRLDLDTLECQELFSGEYSFLDASGDYVLYEEEPKAVWYEGNETPIWQFEKTWLENMETGERTEVNAVNDYSHIHFLKNGLMLGRGVTEEPVFVPYP